MSEIKPCVFCENGSDDVELILNDKNGTYHIYCWNCDACGPNSRSKDVAIETWNKAHSLNDPQPIKYSKMVEAMEALENRYEAEEKRDQQRFELVKAALPKCINVVGNMMLTVDVKQVAHISVEVADAVLAELNKVK